MEWKTVFELKRNEVYRGEKRDLSRRKLKRLKHVVLVGINRFRG
jgi:hypothetical protein